MFIQSTLILTWFIIIILSRQSLLLLIFVQSPVVLSIFSRLGTLERSSKQLFHKKIRFLFRVPVHRLKACVQNGFLCLEIFDLSLSHSGDKDFPYKWKILWQMRSAFLEKSELFLHNLKPVLIALEWREKTLCKMGS